MQSFSRYRKQIIESPYKKSWNIVIVLAMFKISFFFTNFL